MPSHNVCSFCRSITASPASPFESTAKSISTFFQTSHTVSPGVFFWTCRSSGFSLSRQKKKRHGRFVTLKFRGPCWSSETKQLLRLTSTDSRDSIVPLEFAGYKRVFVYLPKYLQVSVRTSKTSCPAKKDMKNIESFAVHSKNKIDNFTKTPQNPSFLNKKLQTSSHHTPPVATSRMLRFHACSVSASARGKSKCRGRSHANFSICACILQKLLNTSTFNVPKFEATMNSDKTGWKFAS